MLLAAEREAIVEHGRKLITSNLTTGSGGNLSIINRENNLVAIKPIRCGLFSNETRRCSRCLARWKNC